MEVESSPDHPRSLVLSLHLTVGSSGDPILPFKTFVREFDLALMAGLARSTHHPDRLECGQRALMEKLGGRDNLPLVLH